MGITGYPLTYTQSPGLHRAFLRATKRRGSYEVYPFDPARGRAAFFRFLDALGKSGVVGLNVTVPFKEWAYAYALKRGGVVAGPHGKCARLAGAANTLVFRGRKTLAANTDAGGLWRDLARWTTKPFDVAVVGTGGAAKGALAGVLAGHASTKKVERVSVWGRSRRKAAVLQKKVKRECRETSVLIVLWCLTPLSRSACRKVWLELEPRLKGRKVYLYDLNYGGRADCTEGLVAAARRKTGLGMLRFQARESFDLWASAN